MCTKVPYASAMFPPSKSNRTTRVDTDDDVILPPCLETLDMLCGNRRHEDGRQVTKVGDVSSVPAHDKVQRQ
jgi:hypothetical protein